MCDPWGFGYLAKAKQEEVNHKGFFSGNGISTTEWVERHNKKVSASYAVLIEAVRWYNSSKEEEKDARNKLVDAIEGLIELEKNVKP